MTRPPFDPQELVATFTRYDADTNDGKGRSDSPDSGHLGWGEAGWLESYVKLYETTGDRGWLDRIVDHFDRIATNVEDHFGDGAPTWVTATYSVAWVRAEPMHNRGTGEISLLEDRVWTTRGGAAVDAAEYFLEFTAANRFRIFSYPSWKPIAAEESYRSQKEIEGLRPFRLALSGKPATGDRFRIQTFAPQVQEYVVHQGMFLHPVARFIEIARSSRSLKSRYGAKASAYLDLITRIANRHERHWLDTGRTAGAYRFPPGESERYPNRILPHNQYLALGRAYIILKDACRRQIFADRAARMAANFKRHLRRTDLAYTWHYWDWIEAGEEGHSAVEDTSHGHIDIGFAIDACRRHLLFRDADLRRFAATLTEQMWNGSLEEPTVGHRVDTREGEARTFRDWIDLCQWDPKIWDICWARFCQMDSPVAEIPTILRGWQRLQERGNSRP
ncbi:MAG: hypothetical protein HOC74_29685 [Gemmatimonadetes bacterium]|nr:hypothetical protein [Gemmatimonadota bacterium]